VEYCKVFHLNKLLPYSKIIGFPEKISMEKHSSLFGLTVVGEEKGFIALTSGRINLSTSHPGPML
jgi:hypothetical protein